MDQHPISRRTVLGGALGASAAVALSRVAAEDATPSPVASPAGDPDILKSSVPGVPDAVLRAPKPFKSYEGTPAKGGKVHYSHLIYTPPATGHDSNSYWQEMEKRLGLDSLEIAEIPVDSYEEKISALIASADMGDMVYLNAGEGGAAIINKAIGQGAFVDLTEYLTGDSLKKYKNLAALPEDMWKQSMVNGKIFGIPNPIYQGANLAFVRADWQKKLGITPPKNADEFKAMFDGFTNGDPDGNGKQDTWGAAWTSMHIYNQMFRVPNGWRKNDDGTLTHMYETDEYMKALDFRRDLVTSKYVHPDAATNTQAQQRDLMNTNRIGCMSEGFGTWFGANGTMATLAKNIPGGDLQPIIPFGYDGGKGVCYPLPAYYGITAFPITSNPSKERIEELLRVCDYLLPPFGSEEFNFQVWGKDGVHNTVDESGGRTLTTKGEADIAGLLYGFVVQDLYIYHPGFPEHSKLQQKLVEETKAMGITNPTTGIYSEKATELGPKVTQYVVDAVNEYVLGHKDKASVQKAIERWKAEGGDEIRKDYERLLKEQGK